MAKKTLEIAYEVFKSPEELNPGDRALYEEALAAMTRSYAPYSQFNVGSAVRLSDGRIFRAGNQENSAYPSGLCAERVALFAAHNDLQGAHISDLAVAGGKIFRTAQGADAGQAVPGSLLLADEPVCSCGACAQVLLEFEDPAHPVNILFIGKNAILKLNGAASLLPFAFGK